MAHSTARSIGRQESNLLLPWSEVSETLTTGVRQAAQTARRIRIKAIFSRRSRQWRAAKRTLGFALPSVSGSSPSFPPTGPALRTRRAKERAEPRDPGLPFRPFGRDIQFEWRRNTKNPPERLLGRVRRNGFSISLISSETAPMSQAHAIDWLLAIRQFAKYCAAAAHSTILDRCPGCTQADRLSRR